MCRALGARHGRSARRFRRRETPWLWPRILPFQLRGRGSRQALGTRLPCSALYQKVEFVDRNGQLSRYAVAPAPTVVANGTFGSGIGVLKAMWIVGSVPPFQLRCGTPAGKYTNEPGGASNVCPSTSMFITPLMM